DRARAGLVSGNKVIDLGYPDMVAVLEDGARARETARRLAADPPASATHLISAVKIHAPLPRPPKFILIGLNYRDHAIESGLPIPSTPTVFSKYSNTVI